MTSEIKDKLNFGLISCFTIIVSRCGNERRIDFKVLLMFFFAKAAETVNSNLS